MNGHSTRSIRIWHARVSDWISHTALLEAMLTPRWLDRVHQYVRTEDRFLRCLTYALLRHAAAMELSVEIDSLDLGDASRGKPRFVIAPPHFSFSFSHTDGMAVVATTDGRAVGIDVEAVHRRIDLSLLLRSLSPNERAWVESEDGRSQEVRFIEIWTLKEALLKGTEEGLAGDLQGFSVVVGGEGVPSEITTSIERNGMIWQIHRSREIDGYAVGLAFADDGRDDVPIIHHAFSVEAGRSSPALG